MNKTAETACLWVLVLGLSALSLYLFCCPVDTDRTERQRQQINALEREVADLRQKNEDLWAPIDRAGLVVLAPRDRPPLPQPASVRTAHWNWEEAR